MEDISLIIVTYNSSQFIGDCLDSISAQKNKDFEVVIIDNDSTDETVEIIKQKLPGVYLINNKENFGFSKGVNQGIGCSKGENIFVLNGDIVLREDFMAQLKDVLLQLPDDVGMVSPKLLRMDKQHIDSTGLMLSRMRRFYDRGQGSIDSGQFDKRQDIFGPCAAAAIYKRQMLEDIKINEEYFDEDFFVLLEDFDIAWRARRYGWKAMFFPQLVCYHHGGISRNKTPLSQYYTFRNRYFLLLKNEETNVLWRFLLFIPLYELPRLVYLLIFNRYTLRALKELRRMSPRMAEKRKIIQQKAKINELCG